ncbi:hypothetical protein KK062_24440 [Fulvivirgaceae bacterium PWU5]|uniref:Uncharacterized protein n=1 Tax=Dawidia cretensis TaxID=2782350 RepID=A0AAP2E3I3_9BACT|nr:hypothetical protein [Dawidia cretensis]MBT1711414.1 hypothetical protein [Dawidia cretensis]
MKYQKYLKYAKYLLIFFIIVVGLSMYGKYNLKRRHPPFILEKLESMQQDESLLDSIGGYRSFEYFFNKNDYQLGDTLSYRIVIKGGSRDAIYKGFQAKNDKGEWELKKGTFVIK